MKRYLLFILCFLFATGQFVEAKKFKYPNGDFYEGKWKKGMPNGQGTMIYANGDEYIGEWVDGHYCGLGKLISKELTYNGNFANDKPNGQGTMIYANGDKYVGEWIDGHYCGLGVLYLKDLTYEGVFANDSLNGEGEIRCDNKVIGKGLFINNKLKEGVVNIKDENYICNCEIKDFNPFSGTVNKFENGIDWQISYDKGNRTGHFKSQRSSNTFSGTEENGVITNIEFMSSAFLTYTLTKKDNGWLYSIKYLDKEFYKDNNSLCNYSAISIHSLSILRTKHG